MADMNIIVGATDAATPVLRRVRGESDRLGESLRRAAQASSRIGGAAGSIGGRVLGGAAMGGGFAAAAMGGMAITGILASIRGAMDRQAQAAQAQVQALQNLAAIQRTAQQGVEGIAMRGAGATGLMRQLSSRGILDRDIPSSLRGVTGSFQEAAQARIRQWDLRLSDEQQARAERLADAGVPIAEAQQMISRGRSDDSIVRQTMGLDHDQAREVLSRTDTRRAGFNVIAQQAIANQEVEGESFRRAFSGMALGTTEQANRDQLDPLAKALRDMSREMMASENQLAAAAASIGTMGRLMQTVMEMGSLGAYQSQHTLMLNSLRTNSPARSFAAGYLGGRGQE